MRPGDLSRSRLGKPSPLRPFLRALGLAVVVGAAGLAWQIGPGRILGEDPRVAEVPATGSSPAARPERAAPERAAIVPPPPSPRPEPAPAQPARPAVAAAEPMLPRREPVPLPPPLAAPDLPTAALAFAPAPARPVEAPQPAPIAPRPDPQPAAEAPAPPVVVAARPIPAEETAEPAGARVDLNSASVAQLNALEGGGPIGRAIVRGRPYKEPEDLVRKRVVSRATFERIKDQVEAR